jgi:hypothetical protein
MKTVRIAILCIAVIFMLAITPLTTIVSAEEKGKHDTKALAKQSQNPISTLISLPLEGNLNFNAGPEDETDFILNIKPVYPVNISTNWNLINRLIMPVISQGERVRGQGSEFGLGDFNYQAFISPAQSGKVTWGAGPSLVIPTGTNDRLTSDKWSLGPALVVLTMPGNWVVGALAQNVWSFAGDGDNPEVNQFLLQYFINYNMKGGWYLTTAPIITANWKSDSDNQWTVPFGGGVGRVFKIGKQPVNVKLATYYNVEKPKHASDWNLNFQFTFLFPK